MVLAVTSLLPAPSDCLLLGAVYKFAYLLTYLLTYRLAIAIIITVWPGQIVQLNMQ